MKLLLIHQNFPGQFRQLAPYLLKRGHDVVAIGSHSRPVSFEGRFIRYKEPSKLKDECPLGTQLWHEALQRAKIVAGICSNLEDDGWKPNCILAHPGWGETLGIKEIWSDVPQILWPESWVLPEHGGYGLDPLKPKPGLEERLEQLGRNILTQQALQQAVSWVVPTQHQANSFPAEFQGEKMHIIHEGIDTSLACPNLEVEYEVRGISISRNTPTITFVNRNLERLRGFDIFMHSLPLIQKNHPDVRVLIVGDNESGYGSGHPSGRILREVMIEELQGKIDLERIHFLGRVPHQALITILQASWVHVYLSYPFVLGWSLLEAMACGCCIVGSKGMPVGEVIHDGVEGLLVSIHDSDNLANRVSALLNNAELRQQFANQARRSALEWDEKNTLHKLAELVESF